MLTNYAVEDNGTRSRVNPLATRYVAPGRLPWISDDIKSLDRFAENFSKTRRAQIVGVHGSGKTTLLEHFVPRIGTPVYRHDVSGEAWGKLESSQYDRNSVVWLTLRNAHPVMESLRSVLRLPRFAGVLVLDGFEQLDALQRWKVKWWSRKMQCGLLVTAHRSVGLPLLLQTNVNEQLAQRVLRQAFWTVEGQIDLPPALERLPWRKMLDKHRGNLRECLMDVYDQIEALNREANAIGR